MIAVAYREQCSTKAHGVGSSIGILDAADKKSITLSGQSSESLDETQSSTCLEDIVC